MVAIAFDTLASVQGMRAKGIPQENAEAFAHELRAASETDFSHLVTKEEFNTFKSELKHDLAALESRLDARINTVEVKISETKSEIIKWHFGSFVAIIGLLTAILFKLH